jgi:hypothetical protein
VAILNITAPPSNLTYGSVSGQAAEAPGAVRVWHPWQVMQCPHSREGGCRGADWCCSWLHTWRVSILSQGPIVPACPAQVALLAVGTAIVVLATLIVIAACRLAIPKPLLPSCQSEVKDPTLHGAAQVVNTNHYVTICQAGATAAPSPAPAPIQLAVTDMIQAVQQPASLPDPTQLVLMQQQVAGPAIPGDSPSTGSVPCHVRSMPYQWASGGCMTPGHMQPGTAGCGSAAGVACGSIESVPPAHTTDIDTGVSSSTQSLMGVQTPGGLTTAPHPEAGAVDTGPLALLPGKAIEGAQQMPPGGVVASVGAPDEQIRRLVKRQQTQVVAVGTSSPEAGSHAEPEGLVLEQVVGQGASGVVSAGVGADGKQMLMLVKSGGSNKLSSSLPLCKYGSNPSAVLVQFTLTLVTSSLSRCTGGAGGGWQWQSRSVWGQTRRRQSS